MLNQPALTIALYLSSCVLAASTGQGSAQTPEPALTAIRKLQPRLDVSRAEKLARVFYAVSTQADCGIPWEILISISFNESSLGMHNYNARSKDFGLMQINKRNALRYGLSQDRLMKDAAYSIKFACKILRDNRTRYSAKHPYWLGLYRSGTAIWKDNIVQNAKRYDSIVRKTASSIGYSDRRVATAR